MIVEIAGGLLAHSLALIADAGHMFSDAAALGLALFAMRLSRRPADARRSYGYHRAQVLAAFVNGLSLLLIAGWICVEALVRLFQPRSVEALPMLWIGGLGLAVNALAFLILNTGAQENLNLRAALAHVLGDLLGSVAAIAAALVILYTGWMSADPLLSLIVAGLIVKTGWRPTRESAHILLEGAPDSFDDGRVSGELAGVNGLRGVHHVHAWSLTPQRRVLTLHAELEPEADGDRITAEIVQLLRQRLSIDHVTVQVERGDCIDAPCGAAPR